MLVAQDETPLWSSDIGVSPWRMRLRSDRSRTSHGNLAPELSPVTSCFAPLVELVDQVRLWCPVPCKSILLGGHPFDDYSCGAKYPPFGRVIGCPNVPGA